MPNPHFLFPNPAPLGAVVELASEEAHHLQNVLRLKPEDKLVLMDGKGWTATATLTQTGKKSTQARIESVQTHENKKRVRIVFGLPKAPALEALLRKSTEIGTLGFHPLITDHSLHPNTWNSERWSKLIAETCKQCEDPFFPVMAEPLPLQKWLETRDRTKTLVLCDEASRSAKAVFLDRSGVDILIGPEGGWSTRERESFTSFKPETLGLGQNRLRLETAAWVALTLVKKDLGEI